MAFDGLWACRECRATVASSSAGRPPDRDDCPTCGEDVEDWIRVDV